MNITLLKTCATTLLALSISLTNAQTATITGRVESNGKPLDFVTISLSPGDVSVQTDSTGTYTISDLSAGNYELKSTYFNYGSLSKKAAISNGVSQTINFDLTSKASSLDDVVITGTRTEKRRTNSAVIVNIINSKTLDEVVATSLAEGLKYQPGVRVETDCQTCNYTQLRINGLKGGYSQILVNSRPIFSALTGLYGMEQIPVNMIDRIEVVRGGVSALYGSSAIGGTVNIITKIPYKNAYSISNLYQSISGRASDNISSGNGQIVNESRTAGVSFFVSNKNRQAYDANGDNFSEAPLLRDNSFGANLFFKPTENQKLDISLTSIYEYRYGGEQVDKPAYLAQQSEERMHNVLMGSLDYSINFNDNKNTIAVYYGGQLTKRKHYTGTQPDDSTEHQAFFADPPYGVSDVTTHQGGIQFNNRFDKFLGGKAVLTLGTEYTYDKVFDEIIPYNYLINQATKNLGFFAQQDWDISPKLNLLAGFRVDKHNLIDHAIVSPRVSFLYKIQKNTQLRFGWGTGFRAPQAFDADLHIAFAGGGVSRITLAPNLTEERSNSFTASLNYDKATEHLIAGFTVEGFYTHLSDAFYMFPLGTDKFGKRFEKRNGSGATVQGVTLEARANFDYTVQVDAGLTLQKSTYDDAVENIDGLPAMKQFLRTPNTYGYATVTYNPIRTWELSANLLYTGSMELAHFGGEGTGHPDDTYEKAPTFTELGFKVGHTFEIPKMSTGLELFGGIKNIFNAYQTDFDLGKNRDSNYIYGPSLPRTYFIGLRVKSI